MSREFSDLAGLAAHFAQAAIVEIEALHLSLNAVGDAVEKAAKAEIGQYQKAIGPFQDWAPLADSTEESKARKGYPADAPLLATGEARDNFGHEVNALDVVIGSPDERMVYHEFGTAKMPPRPVFGPAALRAEKKIIRILGVAAMSGIIGGANVHKALGYDMALGEDTE